MLGTSFIAVQVTPWCGGGKCPSELPNLSFLNIMNSVHLGFELLDLVTWRLPKSPPARLGFPGGIADEARRGERWGARPPARTRLSPPRPQPGLRDWFFSPQVKDMEETIEELLRRLDEFCGITDAVRVPRGRVGPGPEGGKTGGARAGRPSWQRGRRGKGCGAARAAGRRAHQVAPGRAPPGLPRGRRPAVGRVAAGELRRVCARFSSLFLKWAGVLPARFAGRWSTGGRCHQYVLESLSNLAFHGPCHYRSGGVKPSEKTAPVLQQLHRFETLALGWLMQAEMCALRQHSRTPATNKGHLCHMLYKCKKLVVSTKSLQ